VSHPKRHHWWPQLQSGHWTGADGFINVTKADGTVFKAPPSKIGVEGELYTRYQAPDEKDLEIERWFSSEIEGPFVRVLHRLASMEGISSSPIPAKDSAKEAELRELGFIVPKKVERMFLSPEHRDAINSYLAALLVRNPFYLAKLARFHDEHETPLPSEISREAAIKTVALDNMLYVFELYREKISQSHLGSLLVEGSNELLFSDGGVSAEEPWRPGPLPFDLHAPLTPTMALEVFPTPDPYPRSCFIMRMNNQGTARMNILALSGAQRFVFSRQYPPVEFIKKHFGKAAPKYIGIRFVDGRVETTYDKSRE